MTKERSIFGTIIILLLVCIGILLWYKEFDKTGAVNLSTARTNIPTVDTVLIRPETVTLKQKYIGTVIPIHSVDVLPYISGFIDQVLIKGGQTVKTGQTLFVIQQRQYLAQKEVAKANVESARASLNNAQVYLNRIERTQSKAISQTELDNAKTSFLAAQAKLKAAESQLTVAEVNYDYTVIQSPIDGIVGNVPITKGNYVSPAGQALVQIIQQSPIRVVFTMSNRDYLDMAQEKGDLFAGWIFKLRLSDGRLYPESGVFQYIDNQVASNTSGISVYVDFPNPDGKLMANAYVDVLVEKTVTNALTVDKNLVHLTDKGAFVYAIENGKVARLPVVLGMSVGHQYYVERGLNENAELILGNVPASLIGQPVFGHIRQKVSLNELLIGNTYKRRHLNG